MCLCHLILICFYWCANRHDGLSRRIAISHVFPPRPFNLNWATIFHDLIIWTGSCTWILSVSCFYDRCTIDFISDKDDGATVAETGGRPCNKSLLRRLLFRFCLMFQLHQSWHIPTCRLKCASSFVTCAVIFHSVRMWFLHTDGFPTIWPLSATTFLLPTCFSDTVQLCRHGLVHASQYMHILRMRSSSFFGHKSYHLPLPVCFHVSLDTGDCKSCRCRSSNAITFRLRLYKMKANCLGIFPFFIYLPCRNYFSCLRYVCSPQKILFYCNYSLRVVLQRFLCHVGVSYFIGRRRPIELFQLIPFEDSKIPLARWTPFVIP